MLDTCILIDYSRGKEKAVEFFRELVHRPLIPSLVVGELFAGIRESSEKKLIQKIINCCEVIDLNYSIAELGGKWRAEFGPSHGVGLIDAFIGASAKEVGSCLATLNIKHFPMLSDIEKLRPY